MKKNFLSKKIVIGVVLLALIGLVVFAFSIRKEQSRFHAKLPTYFSYGAEAQTSLQKLKSKIEIKPEEVWRLEEKAFDTVGKTKTDTTLASKFYAALFVAQRDAAFLSYKTSGKFMGSLGPVSREVVYYFFPGINASNFFEAESDPYSELLAKIVGGRIKERLDEDKKHAKPYEIKSGAEYWSGKAPFKGIDTGSWITWLIQSGSQFRLPPPPALSSAEDQKQLEQVRNIFAALSDKQKSAIAYWSSGPGTKTAAGIWLEFASDQMRKDNINLGQILFTRSILAMGIADTEIAAMDSKYTYWVKRPFMRDGSILTYMPTPNHPSYPSDSIAIAGFASTFLEYIFPEQAEYWRSLAEEAANSRVNSGIHFPADVEQASILGRKIAEEVIRKGNLSE